MGLADPEAAMTALREFRALLVADERDLRDGRRRESTEHLFGMQPLIERIASEVDPNGVDLLKGRTRPLVGGWTWSDAITQLDRLIGTLERQPDFQQIFGPVGPTLAARGLHTWVWSAAASLWDDGYYEPAVHQAGLAVQLQTQLKVSRRDLHGKDLYAQAFSVKEPTSKMPRLRFPHIDRDERPDDWASAHEGAMHFGMGCAQGIRNPQAHPSDEITEQEALEQLAALSVLARWVDECEAVRLNNGAARE